MKGSVILIFDMKYFRDNVWMQSKFQNPGTTNFGRKVPEEKEEKKKNMNIGHNVYGNIPVETVIENLLAHE
jgi:dihydroorotate dehydrogenase